MACLAGTTHYVSVPILATEDVSIFAIKAMQSYTEYKINMQEIKIVRL